MCYVQLRIEMENYFPLTYHGLSMVEPPLVLVCLIQEWSRIIDLLTVKRTKEVRSNLIRMGEYC
jgi:hypothetical protein